MVVVALSRGSTIHQQVIKEFSWSFCSVRCASYKVRWMIRRSSQSKIMMGPTGLGHKVPTKLVQGLFAAWDMMADANIPQGAITTC
ncbi:uncharacterized protein LOC118479887 isoform X2 [Helianthus annuus]|uniref:uncharacterized protein LOC118479887 isoform X2 n=1 Tax=Helianthus annuus TaxID=4232 RepID=UPI001652FA32|nr:uncharacterized protein LOC118479887 isoform X2 [Helianthus annuus]